MQVTDSEIGKDSELPWIDEVKKIADETSPAFLIHTGDICYEDGLKRHLGEMNSENMGLPVYYVIGNHDYVEGKYGEKLFESIYGPTWYSFDVGDVHYVVTPIQIGDYASGYSKSDRWKWLENDLANTDPNKKVVIFNHSTSPSDDYVMTYGLNKKLDLKEHNLAAWVFGHYHYDHVKETNGVLNISTGRPDSGGIDSSVSGTRLISVTDGKITTKMYYGNTDEQHSQPNDAAWVTQLEGRDLFSDTLVVGDKVFAATAGDDYPHNCGVYCLDANSGKILWKYNTKNSIKNNIVYADGKIIAQDTDANVYIFNSLENADDVKVVSVPFGTSLNTMSAICVDNGVAYVGSPSAVSAIDINSAKVLWTNERNKGENSPAEFVVAGDKLLVISHWNALVALDKKTGKELWANEDEDIRFRSSTPAVVDENTLIVADDDAIMLVDIATGNIKTKKIIEDSNFSSSSKPYVENGIAYIATATQGIVAYDIAKNEIAWQTAVKPALMYTAPYTKDDAQTVESSFVSVDDKLLFAASDGYVYTVNKNDGKIVNEQFVGAAVFGTPALHNGKVVVCDFAGRVIKFN